MAIIWKILNGKQNNRKVTYAPYRVRISYTHTILSDSPWMHLAKLSLLYFHQALQCFVNDSAHKACAPGELWWHQRISYSCMVQLSIIFMILWLAHFMHMAVFVGVMFQLLPELHIKSWQLNENSETFIHQKLVIACINLYTVIVYCTWGTITDTCSYIIGVRTYVYLASNSRYTGACLRDASMTSRRLSCNLL